MDQITSGAIAGAIAGIVVSIVLGLYRLTAAWFRRRSQIKHIRALIADNRDNVYGRPDEISNLPEVSVSPDAIRYEIFAFMREELEKTLDKRSSEITFDEISQIRHIFIRDNLVKEGAPVRSTLPQGLKYYDGIFSDLEQIAWLRLPRRGASTD